MTARETGASGSGGDAAAWAAREAAQAAAYDGIGDRYDEAFPHKDGQVRCGEWLRERLRPGARVIDLGCGTGLPTVRQLADAGFEVTGVDISPVMCELARRNVPDARIVEGGLLEALDGETRYDAVVAFFSLLNLPKAKMPGALERIRLALEPGGLFALSMVEADVDDLPIPFLGQEIRVTGYFRDELRGLIEAAGFTVEEERALSYAPATTQAQPEIQLFLNCRRAD
jgi:SAM-dependent methyltransferase